MSPSSVHESLLSTNTAPRINTRTGNLHNYGNVHLHKVLYYVQPLTANKHTYINTFQSLIAARNSILIIPDVTTFHIHVHIHTYSYYSIKIDLQNECTIEITYHRMQVCVDTIQMFSNFICTPNTPKYLTCKL